MLNHSHPLRAVHPVLDKGSLGDLLFDADLTKAEAWNAHVATLRAQRRALQAQLDAMDVSNEKTVLAPLRRAADAALVAHTTASTALETARINCEQQGMPLRQQIEKLARDMATPMWPIATEWKSAPQMDAREAALAASTPLKSGGGWLNSNDVSWW